MLLNLTIYAQESNSQIRNIQKSNIEHSNKSGIKPAVIKHAKTGIVKKPLLIFGDSLSMGHGLAYQDSWVSLLAQRLAQKNSSYQVINASIGGDTTASGLARLPATLARSKPVIVVLELGGNDGLRGLDLKQTDSNLSAMIEIIQRHNSKVLLVGIQIPPNYGQFYTKQFKNIYQSLEKRYAVSFLPFLLSGVAGDSQYMLDDGIHPNKQAQKIIVENVWRYLLPLIK